MKKFTEILENVGNIYQKGTPFSNGHRSRINKDGFLENRHLMIDIDSFVVDPSGKIVAIIENKNQIPGPTSKLKNILDPNVVTSQKVALIELCRLLKCKLYVNIEKDGMYYELLPNFSTKSYTKEVIENTMIDKGLKLVSSDNIIFLEFRQYPKVQFKAVFERAGGNILDHNYISQIIAACGSIPYVQVDDLHRDIIFKLDGSLIGSVKSVMYPQNIDDPTRMLLQNKWEEIWRKLGLWN